MELVTIDRQGKVSTYETPRVVLSLDALAMISDAEGMSVGCLNSSRCAL